MDYRKIVEMVPIEKRDTLLNKLVNYVLKSKNIDKMPSGLAKTILHHWQHDSLANDLGLAAILEAAVALESDKTMSLLEEKMQLPDVRKAVRQ
ncbi:MAG: hypothetical protein JSV57_00780 [Candidatus Bathyarchaeota archaeon]|nr:MAG: hypothetical protein JSV57_00780 [Candidatus Bathyarchaeota archaeon]